MLQVLATNFGLSPEDVQLSLYQGEGMIILNGELVVDATYEDYKQLFALELTVEDLPFEKSLPTAVFVVDTTESSHNITVTRAQIKDKNTISIRPQRAYDGFGSYKLVFFCAFVQGNAEYNQQLQTFETIVPEITLGAMSDVECYMLKQDGWILLVLNAATLTFDETEGSVCAKLPGIPETLSSNIPIIFSENQSSETGSRFYPASLENGVMTILKDGNEDEASNVSTKFTKAFILY